MDVAAQNSCIIYVPSNGFHCFFVALKWVNMQDCSFCVESSGRGMSENAHLGHKLKIFLAENGQCVADCAPSRRLYDLVKEIKVVKIRLCKKKIKEY